MYGTIARFRLKPGKESELNQLLQEFDRTEIPGAISSYVYQTDDDPNEYYLAVAFADKERYMANADSPEQDARYQRMRELLEGDPEWHDGEIVYSASWRLFGTGETKVA